MDQTLVARLVAEPDTPEEYERRAVQLKRVITAIRRQESMYRQYIPHGDQQTVSDAAAVLDYLRAHVLKAAKGKRAKRGER